MSSASPLPRVLYIAGYGRSGSTITDILLGNQPGVFAAGELMNLFRALLRDDQCSCSLPVDSCPVWVEVIERISAELPRITWEEGLAITAASDGVHLRRDERYATLWRTIFAGISAASGAGIVVDSSKTGRTSLRRVGALRRAGLDVTVIHLVRDPRAVMWSTMRRTKRKIRQPWSKRLGPDSQLGRAVRAIQGWTIANVAVRDAAVRTRYEDLVTDPATELARIGAATGVDFSPLSQVLHSGTQLEVGHGIVGNATRRRPIQRLKLEEDWRDALPRWGRSIATLGRPLARRYGYWKDPKSSV